MHRVTAKVPQFIVTEDMTEEQKAEVLRRFTESVHVSYITESGERIEPPKVDRAPLAAVCPHPQFGVDKMKWDSDEVVQAIGRPGEYKGLEDFREILTSTAREKGWAIEWHGFGEPPKRKRGRPKGSKNKKKSA